MEHEDKMIGKKDAAKIIGCKLRTLDSWMKYGMIPYYKMSKVVRFKESEVVEFVNSCKINAKGQI